MAWLIKSVKNVYTWGCGRFCWSFRSQNYGNTVQVACSTFMTFKKVHFNHTHPYIVSGNNLLSYAYNLYPWISHSMVSYSTLWYFMTSVICFVLHVARPFILYISVHNLNYDHKSCNDQVMTKWLCFPNNYCVCWSVHHLFTVLWKSNHNNIYYAWSMECHWIWQCWWMHALTCVGQYYCRSGINLLLCS